ncbi:MAG: hypothetical protein QOG34_2543 [Frankiaceae bacterium]|jgi:hypothetical protein|nr:hypothetical protein [Frankiaceae bacterium]
MVVAAGDYVLASDMNAAQAWRVPIAHLAFTVDSAALGTAETVFGTIPSQTYAANTAYRVRFEVGYTSSVANVGAYFRLRKTNLAGAVVVDFQREPELAANNTLVHRMFLEAMFTTLGSPVTAALVLTAATTTGTVVVKGAPPSQIDLFVAGAQSDFPDAQDLT